MASKRTLIADLEDPVPVLVSLVDQPCVEDAIFCSIKQDAESEAEKAGRKISNATLKKIQDAFDNIKTLINDALTERGVEVTGEADKNDLLEELNMDEEKLTELVREAVKAELESQQEQEAEETTEELEAEEEVEEEAEEADPEPSEAEKKLAEAKKRIEELEKKLGEGESQKLEGQDVEKAKPETDRALKFSFEDRDAFGRKIHK